MAKRGHAAAAATAAFAAAATPQGGRRGAARRGAADGLASSTEEEPRLKAALAKLQALLRGSSSKSPTAENMKRYMKNRFEFLGLQQPRRVEIFRAWLSCEETVRLLMEEGCGGAPRVPSGKKAMKLIHKGPLVALISRLLAGGAKLIEREYQHVGLDLIRHFEALWGVEEVADGTIRGWILSNPWWDTVDMIATHGLGGALRGVKESEREQQLSKLFLAHDVGASPAHETLWLHRACLIHQICYRKGEVDRGCLVACIDRALAVRGQVPQKSFAGAGAGSPHAVSQTDFCFFINKGVGWALRAYARHDPEFVRSFCQRRAEAAGPAGLSKLSVREALKHIGGVPVVAKRPSAAAGAAAGGAKRARIGPSK